jgi:glycosyltransferase involved in cell wall biosynthesis
VTPDCRFRDGLSAIIPSKNEGDVVVDVAARALRHCSEVIVVDGHSTDGSVEKLRAMGVTVIEDRGQGKGEALRRGIAHSTGRVVVTLDADGSHDPDTIEALVAPIESGDADMVIGCRMRGGSDEFSGTWTMFVRLWGNNFLTQLINMRFGTALTDTQNGFRAAKSDVLRQLALRENKHTIELEMVLKMLKHGGRVAQVPAHEYARRVGESTLSVVGQTPHFLACLVRNMW